MTERDFLWKKLRANDDGSVDVLGYYTERNPSFVLYEQTVRQYLGTSPDE